MSSHDSTRPRAEGDGLCELGRLLIALYGEAIAGLHGAASAAERNDVLGRLEATVRASEAICQLHLGLDLDNGGEIAANLDGVYRFVQAQMPLVNMRNDAALARRLAGLLEPLLESWTEVVESAETAQGTDVVPATAGLCGHPFVQAHPPSAR